MAESENYFSEHTMMHSTKNISHCKWSTNQIVYSLVLIFVLVEKYNVQ